MRAMLLSVCWYLATAGYQRKEHLLNLIAKSKRCRINLFKRHRFVIALFNSLFTSMTSCAAADLSSSADCDDINADVIIADSRSCTSSQLLIVMTSSLLLIASSGIYADRVAVVRAEVGFSLGSSWTFSAERHLRVAILFPVPIWVCCAVCKLSWSGSCPELIW
ncbi:hypothetical protein F511_18748 [Dorcoceras hygrometricum]|uniref:Uncharacterized protein n=1 Tax=Dorcoceras hygrometricum TaxID=472368 RepID=A0A2Z7B345_9LAMI|nr:hypothetical protein F511_18748 [Dorcoceras hygrometricum]